MATGYWTTERLAFAVTLGGMLIAAAVGWAHFNDRLDTLDHRMGDIEEARGDDRCQQIMARRVLAVEKGDKDIMARLKSLSEEQGCIRQYGVEVAAASRPMTAAEKAAWDAQQKRNEIAFERSMSQVDAKLGTFPADQGGL